MRLNDGLNDLSQNIKLEPFDVVQIRKMPIYEKLQVVYVDGAAFYAGRYVLANKKETVLDIIERAGGLRADANPKGIKIIRKSDRVATEAVETIKLPIPIEYEKIKKNPNSQKNIRLKAGDKIIIPKLIETVKVFGEVELNSEIPYKSRKGTRYYIRSVGGLRENAMKKRIYVIYANGIAKTTKNYIFFKDYPKIEEGCEVIVPAKEKEVRKRFSTAELVGMTGVVGSLTGMTVSIIQLFSK